MGELEWGENETNIVLTNEIFIKTNICPTREENK